MLSREEREELKSLSLGLFGASSKYQRLINGVDELATHEIEQTVPGENGAEATTKMVRVYKLTDDGRKQMVTKFYSFVEVRDLLLGMKAKHDEMIAGKILEDQVRMAKEADEQAVKLAQQQLSGTAVKV